MHIKILLLVAYTILSFTSAISQHIRDFFLMLPDNAVMHRTKETRQQMLREYDSGNIHVHDHYYVNDTTETHYGCYIAQLDSKFGYLKMHHSEVSWEMCMWKTTKGVIYVVASETGCGPACSSTLYFYQYKNDMLVAVEEEKIFPRITAFDIVKPKAPQSILKKIRNLKEAFADCEMVFKLPQKGKDIMAEIGFCFYAEGDVTKDIAKYLPGHCTMRMQWKDGVFVKTKAIIR